MRTTTAIGPRLRWVLRVVLGLFALLVVNSLALAAVTFLEWRTGDSWQDEVYLWNVLLHLTLGLGLILPTIAFGTLHMLRARGLPNRDAARIGYALFAVAVALLATGVLLMRVEVAGVELGLGAAAPRTAIYWLHVALPIVAAWLYTIHRLAGPRIRWRVGGRWAIASVAFAGAMLAWHLGRRPAPLDPAIGEASAWLDPSLARTTTGEPLPLRTLQMNEYCLECHEDTYHRWAKSVHAASSFNNPAYAFSVRETRRRALEREGTNADARFCAGCHDPVPLLAGLVDDPRFDDPHLDPHDPIGAASISCTVCHSVVDVRGTRGNAEYTIEESPQYPFTFSESPLLRWVNRQLIRAKPAFHKRTFLKPEVHHSGEFCATCHKVFLPEELNDYRWLPGQNHWDSFRLSGVSGHGVTSWNYPAKAETDCNGCHMPLRAEGDPGVLADFGAKRRPGAATPTIRDHLFPGGNPAIACLDGRADCRPLVEELQAFNEGTIRLDLVALREDGVVDGRLIAPLRPEVPAVEPGRRYLLEAVVRTLAIGHALTQGTADSNQVWLDVVLRDGRGRVLGRSGGMSDAGEVDPWSRFFNVFLLDRDGRRIDRRNPQDIFTPLYDHQVPPGSGDVTHLAFTVPEDAAGPLVVEAAVRYRKFDTTYLRHFTGDASRVNDLPILTLAEDRLVLPVAPAASRTDPDDSGRPPTWERLQDYAIGLFRQGEAPGTKGPLRQAEEVFSMVEAMGRAEGALGVARTALREGRIDEAAAALARAAAMEPPALPWSIAWFSAQVDRERGDLEAAMVNLRRLVATDFEEARRRGFDFSKDDRLLRSLADTLLLASRNADEAERVRMLEEAKAWVRQALDLDVQQYRSWYLLARIEQALDDESAAEAALAEHARYKPDDNARDRAVALARQRYPAANHAAEAVVIHDLQREGAFGLPNAVDEVAAAVGASGP
ncbi:MAG: multiheme c-type cytochrome [Planctomycetota bacterium]|jgi:tetratricopeptide (TPR) repeat protein